MKAIILAAGQGTRLRPYTNDQPKCMVPLAGIPLLHRQLGVLRSAGIDDITVVGGYRMDQLEAPGTKLVRNPDFDTTNMVATLFCARAAMQPGEDLLISYGDIVFEPTVLSELLGCNGELVLSADREWHRLWATRMDDPLADAETFRIQDGNRVVELGKKPRAYEDVQAQYMGLIRVRGDRVNALLAAYEAMDSGATYEGKDFHNMDLTSLIQHLIDTDWDVRAALVANGWLEVDTATELETYEVMAGTGELDTLYRLSGGGSCA